MGRFSTRIGHHWLLLTHVHDSTWHLQVLGDTPLEAEVTAVDEAEAKSSAVRQLSSVSVLQRSSHSRAGTPLSPVTGIAAKQLEDPGRARLYAGRLLRDRGKS